MANAKNKQKNEKPKEDIIKSINLNKSDGLDCF